MTTDRLIRVEIDDSALPPATPEMEQERRVAIFDLLEDNSLALPGRPEQPAPSGPYALLLAVRDRRLVFELSSEGGERLAEFHLSMAQAGWLGVAMPESVGGAGLGITEAAVMMQAVAESGGELRQPRLVVVDAEDQLGDRRHRGARLRIEPRVVEDLGEPVDPASELLHQCWLAYLSDDLAFDSANRVHPLAGRPEFDSARMGASLDHTIWFHRPLRADRWHLHDVSCLGYFGHRGLALGRVFTEGGDHVATFAQEYLLRVANDV